MSLPPISSRRTALAALTAVAGSLFGAACGTARPNAAASSSPAATPPASPQATGAATPAAASQAAPPAGGQIRFQVVPERSTATFRVREQLAGAELPNDAVGTTGAVTGQLVLQPDGAIVRDASKVTVDLRQLRTDNNLRDNFIKANTLNTGQFPTAEFVPTEISGLPAPLPAAGEHSFKLAGVMTIRGVQKDLTWDVKAMRQGPNLTGTATTRFQFGDFGMTPPRVARVLSITDDIRLEINLVATEVASSQ